MAVSLDTAYELHPKAAVRPEPFGALVYHYGNRRLVFLRKPEVLSVVNSLGEHDSLGHTLAACGISETRWPSFVTALSGLKESDIIRER
jgi:putative mycofactocin binding protein MftB